MEGNLFGRPTVSDADGKSASTISSREASWIAWSPDGRALAVTFIQPREPTAADFPPAPTRPGHPAPSDSPKENGGSPAADIPTVDVGRP